MAIKQFKANRLMPTFIALEVQQNLTAYLRDQVVQIELVLLTATHDLAPPSLASHHPGGHQPGAPEGAVCTRQ
jgi:hypothetical protein